LKQSWWVVELVGVPSQLLLLLRVETRIVVLVAVSVDLSCIVAAVAATVVLVVVASAEGGSSVDDNIVVVAAAAVAENLAADIDAAVEEAATRVEKPLRTVKVMLSPMDKQGQPQVQSPAAWAVPPRDDLGRPR